MTNQNNDLRLYISVQLTAFSAPMFGILIKPGKKEKEKWENEAVTSWEPQHIQCNCTKRHNRSQKDFKMEFKIFGGHKCQKKLIPNRCNLCAGLVSRAHLLNLRAKDLSFRPAAPAANRRSRLFPVSMWPNTPSKPSTHFEWSPSIVWNVYTKLENNTKLLIF